MAYIDKDYAVTQQLTFAGVHAWSMTYGVQVDDPGAVTPNQVATNCRAAFVANIPPLFSEKAVATTCVVRHLLDDAPGIAVGSNVGTHTSGTPLPNNVARVVSLHSTLPGRSGRGRLYLGAAASDMFDGADPNSISAAQQTEILLQMNAFMDDLAAIGAGDGGPYLLSVWSRRLTLLSTVATITCDLVVDTQRRRVRD
jgi:hypothetical protein